MYKVKIGPYEIVSIWMEGDVHFPLRNTFIDWWTKPNQLQFVNWPGYTVFLVRCKEDFRVCEPYHEDYRYYDGEYCALVAVHGEYIQLETVSGRRFRMKASGPCKWLNRTRSQNET